MTVACIAAITLLFVCRTTAAAVRLTHEPAAGETLEHSAAAHAGARQLQVYKDYLQT
jgi:hypothetical protein